MELILPPLPTSILPSNSIKSDRVPSIRKRTHYGLTIVSSFSSYDHENSGRIIVEEVNSWLKSNVVDLAKDDEDKIPLRDMLPRVSVLPPCLFTSLG